MSEQVHALTQRYYDGQLDPDVEVAALDHLAGCQRCQDDLAGWMAIDAAVGGERAAAAVPGPALAAAPQPASQPAPVVPLAPRRARRAAPVFVAVGLAAAAAVAIGWWVTRPGPQRAAAPRLALAPTRAVEVRVADAALDRHRPLRVERGAIAGERFALADLAALEAHAPRAYVGALVLGGDLARARAALGAADDPGSEIDRAALALLAGDPLAALEAADRALAAGPAPAAAWNRALALRDLGLPRTAAAAFAAIAAAGEPGWSDEARALADGLRGPVEAGERALAEFTAAEAALLEGRGAIEPALAARFPGPSRIALHDALRAATSADDARRLLPLAQAIDRATGGDGAARAVARIADGDFAIRGRFAARYRSLVLGGLDAAASDALLGELDRAGPAVADLLYGAIVLAGAVDDRFARLAALAEDEGDPWFTLHVARERARRQRAAGDLAGSEATLRAAIAACPTTVAYRCGTLGLDLAAQLLASLRLAEAAAAATAARGHLVAAGTPALASVAVGHLGEIERLRARFAPMAAYLDEYLAAAPDDCVRRRFVGLERAAAAFWQGDVAGVRAHLPAPGACGEPPPAPQVMVAVDLARLTGDPADRARADAVIAAIGDDPVGRIAAAAARGRLELERDPTAARAALTAAIAGADAAPTDANAGEFRAWAYSTLVDDAAARGDGAAALALVEGELGLPPIAGCVLAVSLDDDRVSAVARTAAAPPVVHRARIAAMLAPTTAELVPPSIAQALAACATVSVVARPPLHARADLLPIDRAWAFVSRPPSPGPLPSAGRAVIIRDPSPPAALGLPRVGTRALEAPGDQVLAGAEATPTRVISALADAAYVELHVHGLVDLGRAEASLLALSPDPDGRFALTAATLGGLTLAGRPIVVLAACEAAQASPLINRRWGLPDALLTAGARAVIAAAVPIPDDDAGRFFAAVRARLTAGASPAQAVAAERAAGGEPWRAAVMVFE